MSIETIKMIADISFFVSLLLWLTGLPSLINSRNKYLNYLSEKYPDKLKLFVKSYNTPNHTLDIIIIVSSIFLFFIAIYLHYQPGDLASILSLILIIFSLAGFIHIGALWPGIRRGDIPRAPIIFKGTLIRDVGDQKLIELFRQRKIFFLIQIFTSFILVLSFIILIYF